MTMPIVNITFWMELFHDNSMEVCFDFECRRYHLFQEKDSMEKERELNDSIKKS